MKKLMIAATMATFVLTGCVTQKHAPAHEELQNSISNLGDGLPIPRYAHQIKYAIEAKIYDTSIYAGKSCSLRLSLAQDGKVTSVFSQGGDPGLCSVALAATKQADIPAPPDDATYQVLKNAVLDFKL